MSLNELRPAMLDKPGRGPGRGPDAIDGPSLLTLLRWSHIFSAAVRETLETQLVRKLCKAPLSAAQFHLLKLVCLNGDHQAGEVADFLGVSAPAATKNIDKLVRLGLIQRRHAHDDRRALRLTARPRGRALVQRYEQLAAALAARGLRSFRADEVKQLIRLLERFAVGLFAAGGVEGGVCLRCGAHIEPNCPVGGVQGGCPYQRTRRAPPRPPPGPAPP